MTLTAADAGEGPRSRPDFRGIIGKRGDVVAVQSDGVRELAAGNLHAVARVAREPNDRPVDDFPFGLWCWWNLCECRHSWPKPPLPMNSPVSPRGVRLDRRTRRRGKRTVSQADRREPTVKGYHTDSRLESKLLSETFRD